MEPLRSNRSRAFLAAAATIAVCLFAVGSLLELRGHRTLGLAVRGPSGVFVAAGLLAMKPRSTLYRILALLSALGGIIPLVLRLIVRS